jgi:low affinity Fe/Cu permease
MRQSVKDRILEGGVKHCIFLNNVEGWIDEVISRNGLAEHELVRLLKNGYERSIQANIDYYTDIIERANGDIGGRHRIMAKVYRELLPAR